MADTIGHKKKAMVQALAKTLGIVSKACEMVDISRDTHYRWLKEDPEYKREVDSIAEAALDFAESKLFELIDGADRVISVDGNLVTVKDTPNPTATIFYLKTKGKHRGYVERQEIDGKMQVQNVDLKNVTTEDLNEAISRLDKGSDTSGTEEGESA